MMEYQIPRQGSIGLQSRWHWDVYLDDADDFYFWFCEKISKISKINFLKICPPLLENLPLIGGISYIC